MNFRPFGPALAGCATLAVLGTALASSHREAPFITTHPKVDGTDFYMFNSYEPGRAGYVTLIANYQPFESPQGGPNYYTMDPKALYEIHIDNDGDGHEDLTFQFRFKSTDSGAPHDGSEPGGRLCTYRCRAATRSVARAASAMANAYR